ncbi:hypothetical protein LIT13_06675 [Flavobacterium psychrophilum]|uniref:hypothetical protein n=1 Tax=Flavobacterium phage Fpv7 TaxID=1814287 RepID=UPI00078B5C46|nr:hypothetical protein [Flavobacterium psychrophilum]YP_009321256.1 hypothetical protein BOW77_gp51 [Flavobacterium phage Fpv7]YP_009322322.1 hypothetical protein BOW76_gp51 [Flavobacterium phage Fpv8]YP_009322428.1 hypothetical protein BOW79_gp51 [Flavobacterium phage Fpv5]YP_009323722.1 hypothetical protein BOW72_gp51 [Flavobacterium phage Fpv10]YP_009324574.1 hypothetical protein BOW78_gp51 [Flavobacterium phage Fpv6]YP_009325262.1 hypothetical protein BOW83_gp51 [Flavobacterium phage Fpv
MEKRKLIKSIFESINYDFFRLAGNKNSDIRRIITEWLLNREIKFKKDVFGINEMMIELIKYCEINIENKCQAQIVDEIKIYLKQNL